MAVAHWFPHTTLKSAEMRLPYLAQGARGEGKLIDSETGMIAVELVGIPSVGDRTFSGNVARDSDVAHYLFTTIQHHTGCTIPDLPGLIERAHLMTREGWSTDSFDTRNAPIYSSAPDVSEGNISLNAFHCHSGPTLDLEVS